MTLDAAGATTFPQANRHCCDGDDQPVFGQNPYRCSPLKAVANWLTPL